MHRGRFGGGNARKRKAKLTDATFQAMIGGAAGIVEDAVGTIDPSAEDDDGVAMLVAVPPGAAAAYRPSAGRDAGGVARPFLCQEYRFGYATCRNCQNDQAYYVHQADLVTGYTFRCRVCRMEMTVSTQA